MKHDDDAGFATIAALRRLLDGHTQMLVINTGGDLSPRDFAFGPPATEESILMTERELGITFPLAYRAFLLTYDGLTLYDEPEFHQWGFRMYGMSELKAAQERLRDLHRGHVWPSSYLAIAETCGDLDGLVLDTARPTHDGADCVVLDAFSGERPDQWEVADRGVSDWLEHLVVSQGSKYWLWRT